jgi:hypothetical protein
VIKLRGHHLICLQFFHGGGADAGFDENLRETLRRAEKSEMVEVCQGPDDICHKCLHLNDKQCGYEKNSDAEIREMDLYALQLLNLMEKSWVVWSEISGKMPFVFNKWSERYCGGCDWKTACKTGLYEKTRDTV